MNDYTQTTMTPSSVSHTPEHDRRGGEDEGFGREGPLHPEIDAAYDYVDRVKDRPDKWDGISPMWYGWALREAFLAGITHAQCIRNPTQPKE